MDQPSQESQVPGEDGGRKSNAMVELDLLLPKANGKFPMAVKGGGKNELMQWPG